MAFSAELKTYHVYYFGNRNDSVKAFIYAKDADNHLRTYLIFAENGSDLPNSSESVMQGVKWCRIWYHIDQFPAVIDILRNEEPVFVNYSNPTFAQIFTGSEPIGEGELGI
jgi:hypothetical protein